MKHFERLAFMRSIADGFDANPFLRRRLQYFAEFLNHQTHMTLGVGSPFRPDLCHQRPQIGRNFGGLGHVLASCAAVWTRVDYSFSNRLALSPTSLRLSSI